VKPFESFEMDRQQPIGDVLAPEIRVLEVIARRSVQSRADGWILTPVSMTGAAPRSGSSLVGNKRCSVGRSWPGDPVVRRLPRRPSIRQDSRELEWIAERLLRSPGDDGRRPYPSVPREMKHMHISISVGKEEWLDFVVTHTGPLGWKARCDGRLFLVIQSRFARRRTLTTRPVPSRSTVEGSGTDAADEPFTENAGA
jgi:hypothetical protein